MNKKELYYNMYCNGKISLKQLFELVEKLEVKEREGLKDVA